MDRWQRPRAISDCGTDRPRLNCTPSGVPLASVTMWYLEPGRVRSVRFGPVFGLPQRRQSMMNRQRLARSRSGRRRAASRVAVRAGDPTRRLPPSRITPHVTPEPHLISAGRSRQRSPVSSTTKMPASAARFETSRRPGFFSRRGLAGGSNGSIRVHNASSMTGLPISSASVIPVPEANSLPRKLAAPRGPFLIPFLRNPTHVWHKSLQGS